MRHYVTQELPSRVAVDPLSSATAAVSSEQFMGSGAGTVLSHYKHTHTYSINLLKPV
jgi:hypothetical protein